MSEPNDCRLRSGPYLGEISGLCFLHLPHPLSSLPYLLAGNLFCLSPSLFAALTEQASILGNLEEFGVLKNADGHMSRGDFPSDGPTVDDACVPAVVEFGAGRGYLTQMLADCYGIKKVFLVERKSYKLKADRSLRQKDSLILERLRIDILMLNFCSRGFELEWCRVFARNSLFGNW